MSVVAVPIPLLLFRMTVRVKRSNSLVSGLRLEDLAIKSHIWLKNTVIRGDPLEEKDSEDWWL